MGAAGARIRAAIAERGPITFAEYTEMALLGPGGFFEDPPVGPTGAFLTAPHVHAVFADLVRFALADLRDGLGRPDPFRVVDLGAGDGTLAAALASGFRDLDGVACAIEGVDASAGARAAMAARGIPSAAALADLAPGDPAVVLGNEVLDNLPFRWLRGGDRGPVELRIDASGDAFVPVESPCDPSLAALAGDLPAGVDAFVSPAALALVDALAAWLRRGYALLIDYGWPDRPAHEVHGYRDHRLEGDVLADPGSRDITAGVDFGPISRRATERGLVVLGEVRQDDALRTLGYEDWQDAQRERQAAARAGGDAVAELRIWEGRGLASILVDPERMGGFRWLLLGTPGLPAPTWV
ncbi:MAG: SAM-dependent methyltransferase [Actinomycetota bacterium]